MAPPFLCISSASTTRAGPCWRPRRPQPAPSVPVWPFKPLLTYYKPSLASLGPQVLWLSLYALGTSELSVLRAGPTLALPSQVTQTLFPEGGPAATLLAAYAPPLSRAILGGGGGGSKEGLPWFLLLGLAALPGVCVKQVCNWVQLKDAVDSLVEHEVKRMA